MAQGSLAVTQRPLRSIRPLLAGTGLLMAALLGGYFVLDRVITIQQTVESDSRKRIAELVSLIDANWDLAISEQRLGGIQTSIANLMASGNYRTIALIDPDNRVLAANRMDWLKQHLLILSPGFNDREAALARQRGMRIVRFADDNSLMRAYLPISLHGGLGELKPDQTSALFIEYDLSQTRQEKRQQAARHIGGFLAFLLLLTGAGWLLVQRFFQQPLDSLTAAARRMAAGDVAARASLASGDEWGELGGILDALAEQRASDRREHIRQQQLLAESERKYRSLFDDNRDGVAVLDIHGRFVDANACYQQMLGYSLEQLRHLAYTDVTPERWHAMEAQIVEKQLFRQGYTDEYEKEYVDRQGRVFPVSVKCSLIRDEQGNITGMWGTARDLSERKKTEAKLQLAARVFDNSGEGIAIADNSRVVVSANRAFSTITGYAFHELYGRPLQIHSGSANDDSYLQGMWSTLDNTGYWEGELAYRHRDGSSIVIWLTLRLVRDEFGHPVNYIAHLTDISERRAWEEHFRYLTEHDHLTGLPNRTLFQDRVQQAILQCLRSSEILAVISLDLDRFKTINDSLGHPVGDRLLHAVAQRLKSCLRDADSVCRQGSDEFLLLLPRLQDIAAVEAIVGTVESALSAPYLIDEYEFSISSSLGIALYPRDGEDCETLIRHADAAMYQAKAAGRNSHHFFTHELSVKAIERAQIESGLKRALEHNALQVCYQPQIDISNGRIIGAEALLRWQHPEQGQISPLRFIPVAEETGLIVPIGHWVLQEACLQAQRWHRMGYPLTIAVNISAIQFRQKSLEQSVNHALARSGLPPQHLELELTEGLIMEGSDSTIGTMHRLREIGVKLSIDDFGTGYSSLSYLKRFPIDKLKIDQSFVRDITTDPDDAAITRAIIHMAQSLKLSVIAEGVETPEQLAFLTSHQCNEYQGYLCSKPVAADDFTRLLIDRQPPDGQPQSST